MGFSVKINTKDLAKNLSISFNKAVKSVTQDEKLLRVIGNKIADDVKFQVGRGNVLQDNGTTKAQKPLKESTIKSRERLARLGNNTAPTYDGADTANLSMSGQFIRSIQILSIVPHLSKIIVGPEDAKRSRYRGASGETISNETLGEYQTALGRFGIAIRNQLRVTLNNIIIRAAIRALRK